MTVDEFDLRRVARDLDLAEEVGASVARAIGDVLDHVHTTHDRKERPNT